MRATQKVPDTHQFFMSTSRRFGSPHTSAHASTLGPGSYDVGKTSDTARSDYANANHGFMSTATRFSKKRAIKEETPGVGSYHFTGFADKVKGKLSGRTGAFMSTTRRFMHETENKTPGPGAYEAHVEEEADSSDEHEFAQNGGKSVVSGGLASDSFFQQSSASSPAIFTQKRTPGAVMRNKKIMLAKAGTVGSSSFASKSKRQAYRIVDAPPPGQYDIVTATARWGKVSGTSFCISNHHFVVLSFCSLPLCHRVLLIFFYLQYVLQGAGRGLIGSGAVRFKDKTKVLWIRSCSAA